MDRNSLKARVVRISVWTAGGLSLPAIGLIVAGAGAKGDVGLHLTVWGIQLMLVVTVLAVTVLVLRVGLHRISWRIKRMRIFKSREAIASGVIPVTLQEGDEDRSDALAGTGISRNYHSYEEIPAWSVLSHMNAHYNWDTDKYDAVRGPGGWYDPPYDITKD